MLPTECVAAARLRARLASLQSPIRNMHASSPLAGCGRPHDGSQQQPRAAQLLATRCDRAQQSNGQRDRAQQSNEQRDRALCINKQCDRAQQSNDRRDSALQHNSQRSAIKHGISIRSAARQSARKQFAALQMWVSSRTLLAACTIPHRHENTKRDAALRWAAGCQFAACDCSQPAPFAVIFCVVGRAT